MEHQIVTFYLLCHELLTALEIREDCQIKMNNAEVMVVVLLQQPSLEAISEWQPVFSKNMDISIKCLVKAD